MSRRPRYADLPPARSGFGRCAWGVFGPDDELGTVNLVTDEAVRRGVACVRKGERFALSLPLDLPSPTFFSRRPVEHTVMRTGQMFDDRLDSFYPQGSTQWDGLGHYGHSSGFWNGRSHEDIESGGKGILAVGEVGIVSRGVLLDVAGHRAGRGVPLDPFDNVAIGPDELAEVARAEGVELCEGDVVCVRTGWVGRYLELDADGRLEMARLSRSFPDIHIAGLDNGEDMTEFLWDHGVAAVAVDNPTVEAVPHADRGAGFDNALHARAIGLLGLTFGEFFVLDALADACRADGRCDFCFTSAPLLLRGGIGSPPNALAVR